MSLRDPGTIFIGRSAGSCGSWVQSWREDEAGGSQGLEGHLLRNLVKGLGEVREKGRIEK